MTRLSIISLASILGCAGVTGATAQERTTPTAPRLVAQLGHSGQRVWSVAISPDDDLVLTGDGVTGMAVLWEAETGAELRRFALPTDNETGVLGNNFVSVLQFSPDGGRALLAGGHGAIGLWDVATGAVIRRFEGHRGPAMSGAFSPDGRWVVTGGTDGARVWDARTGAERARLAKPWGGSADAIAVSPQGDWILTGAWNGTARLWDADTGAAIEEFEGRSCASAAMAVSPDGRTVLTGCAVGSTGGAILWEARTGEELRHLADTVGVLSVALSPDGRRALTGRSDSTAVLWDVETGARLRRFGPHAAAVTGVAFSSDGREVLTGGGNAVLWDAETGRELRRFEGLSATQPVVAFSPVEPRVLTAVSGSPWDSPYLGADGLLREDERLRPRRGRVALWDLERGGEARRFADHAFPLQSAAFAPDGRRVLTADGSTGRVWDVATGERSQQLRNVSNVTHVALSPDGERALTGQSYGGRDDTTAVLWDVETGAPLARLQGHSSWVWSLAFSPDGEHALTGSLDRTARIWDLDTRAESRRLEGHTGWVLGVAYSPDGRLALTGSEDSTAALWEVETGEPLRRLEGHTGSVESVAFSPDGLRAVTGSRDGTARLWDVDTGAELLRFEGHSDWVLSATFSRDGRLVLTGANDGTARLWDPRTGALLATLISFRDGTWAVVSPDGRFDVPDLERVDGIHWVFPDAPLQALSIEVFMRDYYEPRLLPRVLAGEELPAIEGLGSRNRVQPEVRITTVDARDTAATVTVEVESRSRRFGSDSIRIESRAADLRLFRDGQVVRWRDGPLELDPETGVAQYMFENLRLPMTGADSVTFSAYAFNEDFTSADGREWIGRVKSATAYATVALPDRGPRRGRAYVVTVGVDAYQDSLWDLRFAANDAWALSEQLSRRLEGDPVGVGPYDEGVPVPLVAAHEPERTTDATKEVIRGVLDLLAGREVPTNVRARIPNADRIRRATPEDLVIVTFSSHGYADSLGTFYLLPSDIGEDTGKRVTPALLERAVSSEELAAWLRPVDAGELVLIVDACHSAAAVEGAGFKPGPMGSRGFGQLAFDKGMRVLAASQAEDVALESELLEQGLLTHALVRDGLESEQADHDPADGVIELGEWLRYGVDRVPTLFEEVQAGEVQTFGRSETVGAEGDEDPLFQVPALFDFRKDRVETPLTRGTPP